MCVSTSIDICIAPTYVEAVAIAHQRIMQQMAVDLTSLASQSTQDIKKRQQVPGA